MKLLKRILLITVAMAVIFAIGGCGKSNRYEFKEKDKFIKLREDYTSKYKRCYLEEEKHILRGTKLKLTLEKSKYMYYGELKDNKPNGEGVLLKNIDKDDIYAIRYVGQFKDGTYNGFGLHYDNLELIENEYLSNIGIEYLSYEGEFKNGRHSGRGKLYLPKINTDNYEEVFNNYIDKNGKVIENFKDELYKKLDSEVCISNMPLFPSRFSGYGEFKNNKLNGNGTEYYQNGNVKYTGEFRNDEYSGYGKLYYENGNIEYEGKFKNSKYAGKGTLYNEDGSVKYKGKWLNGDQK